MKKISVIIPMYNAAQYIEPCIQSVQNQTCGELEILVIDDGSTDFGPAAVEKLRRSDDRVRLIRQENGGVSRARNHGLDAAEGEYVFFLDSDDAIHPRLLEELSCQADRYQADLVFCCCRKLKDGEFQKALRDASADDRPARWKMAEAEEAEQWLHLQYVNELTGIGGKLVRTSRIRDLRFDEGLSNGEDTYFLYELISRGVRIGRYPGDWYYYRMHEQSITHSAAMLQGDRYVESCRRVRDLEYGKGRMDYALTWEGYLIQQMKRAFLVRRSRKDRKGQKSLRKTASMERKHPLYRRLFISTRFLFWCCFYCYPLYAPLGRFIPALWKLKESIVMSKKDADVGILTFHCSDNYGAMLQACGLKTWLKEQGVRTDVVRYEPPYMTGRHWFIPYVPIPGLKGRIWCLKNMLDGYRLHRKMGEDYTRQRANMRRFREEHLVDSNHPRLLFAPQLSSLPYRNYVVGSDQIWNPNITCGLRKAYFGAFSNKRKKNVVAYAASFGGASIPSAWDGQFAKLIQSVDAVSVREEAAIPYVKRFCKGEVTAVLDPVFFLPKETWQKMERAPEKKGYIFVYITEKNQELTDYVKKLSKETGLPVIETRTGRLGADDSFQVDYTTGPAEFLGYIHHADYVVTNSFHGIAFSIIFRKRFLAFLHRSLGARIRNILKLHGLEGRICEEGNEPEMEGGVDWDAVAARTEELTRDSGRFLLEHLSVQ